MGRSGARWTWLASVLLAFGCGDEEGPLPTGDGPPVDESPCPEDPDGRIGGEVPGDCPDYWVCTEGEDGKVCASAGETTEVLAEAGRKWISSVASGPQGAIAYAAGRSAFVRFSDGRTKEFQHPRTVEGLAFSPKGMRFGVARYNGVTLHFPATDGKPTELEWAGAHTAITFSPEGRVSEFTLSGEPVAGAPVAGCVESYYKAMLIPAFEGRPFTIHEQLTLR